MHLTFQQFLLERLSKEQPPGTSDLGGNGIVKISGAEPKTVEVKGSEVLTGTSPEKVYGKRRKR